jgi:DNA-binding beta-propeller fold protein YncE
VTIINGSTNKTTNTSVPTAATSFLAVNSVTGNVYVTDSITSQVTILSSSGSTSSPDEMSIGRRHIDVVGALVDTIAL